MSLDETNKVMSVIIEKIIKEYSPEKIILFGSYANGKQSVDSDIDLLIIKNTDKRPIERWMEVKKLLRDFSRTIPVTPLVYTEKEIDERRAINDFFIDEIFKNGKVLYG